MPLLNRMILVPPGGANLPRTNEPLLRPDLAAETFDAHRLLGPYANLQGVRGTAVTILRPSGKAQFGDRMVDVISDGPFIEVGRNVQVIEINGNRVVVREIS
jgi:membrane-bound serine protease (ClpP class)